MKNKILTALCGLLAVTSFATTAFAAGGGPLMHADVNLRDTAALQRGAKVFVNYCFSCHSAQYMRYNRLAEDLDLTEEQVSENLMFADAKIGDLMKTAMTASQGEAWFDKAPPDLSLTARSRGADWVYTYMLTFYRDESGGWNNQVLPNAAMPHVLWSLQGVQEAVVEEHDGLDTITGFELVEPGLQSPEEYERTVRDLVTFMEYLSEPAQLTRRNAGVWVMLYLALFALVAYALKAEYWRDVH